MMNSLPISIIIITLNESKHLPELLNDLKNQTDKQFEILVVDSNSDDNTVQIAHDAGKHFTEFQVVKMSRRGVSLGRNTGVEFATYEQLLFLDADVRILSNFIADLKQQLHKKPVLVAAGLMRAKQGVAAHVRFSIWLFNQLIRFTRYWFPTAVGACIYSTKTVHHHIGGFNESLSLCEDADYANRASKLFKFRVLPVFIAFDTRRLTKDGFFKTGFKYIYAFLHRLFIGELTREQIEYSFGHYDDKK